MTTLRVVDEARWTAVLASLPAAVDRSVMHRALLDAERLYEGHAHRTGIPLVEHCVTVLGELARFEPDTELAVVTLLHHAPELHTWSFDEIGRTYGPGVRTMLGEVHVLRHLTTHNRRVSIDRLRLNFFRVSKDLRVFMLMLCHQLMTMHHLEPFTPEERRRISSDSMHLYAPAAARLGIYSIKHQLEDASFPVLYPVDHERITEQLAALREKHGAFLRTTSDALAAELERYHIAAEIEGREKHPYSIFQKMRRKTVTHIESIPDLFALRVVVKNEATCYQTLGLIHQMGYPVQNRFKDYIAFPKPNGYQSLHTTLLGLPHVPPGIMVEIQIRTPAMHREANIGIAAHWSYKEGNGDTTRSAQLVERAFLHDEDDGPRSTGLADHIFVLTPKGDVVELPDGATPLDFAFQVHTAVGLSFKAARVNGSIMPLDYHLENGDVVEIVRNADPRPSPRWISLLKTASARNRLKRHLAEQHRPQLLEDGRSALNRELKRLHLPMLDTQLHLLRRIDGRPATLLEREDFLVSIGQGNLSVAAALLKIDALAMAKPDTQPRPRAGDQPMVPRVEGSIPMPVRLAKCCKPSEDERPAIIGVIGRHGEVRIHRANCSMLRMVNPERRIHATWTAAVTPEARR